MHSIWSATAERESHPPLTQDIETDVLIIGAGMCGVLTAYFLKQAGVRTFVVDAKEIGSGTTKNTTAKITAQHGLIYANLIKRFGTEKTRQYYEANTKAIAQYHALSQIFPCDFEEKTAYVYAREQKEKLLRELDAYQKLNIAATLKETVPLPLPTVGAIAMAQQAQFHPLKLLFSLADTLDIYENTLIYQIEGNVAHSSRGKIKAEHIVLATHYPLINIPGLYFLKLYQHRSYVLALKNTPTLSGMYIDEAEDGFSFRMYDDLLFIGGGAHRTGKSGGGYDKLRTFAEKSYPVASPEYTWATQDCMSLDAVPYIGRHRRGKEHLYVATGFHKWGMTSSMVAAELLSDMILGRKNDWEALFAPDRSILSHQLFKNIGSAVAGLASLGAPRCSHMGCKLKKNITESTWDCPCHGSRFTKCGQVIDNPAKKGIRR